MMVSKYFATLGIEVEKGSVKKVDKALDHVENRLKRLGTFANKPIVLNIGSFDVDQKKLNFALGNALDMASNRLVFQIDRFDVNQAALNRSVGSAILRASATNPLNVNSRGVGGSRIRESAAAGAVAGGVGGLRGMPNLFGPALALGLGGYGLSALNQRNQQVVSAQLQTSAVVQQAGGTAAQGADSFQYLRSEANRIGFNYLDASGDYNKLISGLTGSGVGLGESQKVFSGFAELARVNKLDKTTQNRLFRALSQVAGKGKLQAEELTGQIAEALPGGTALFARAYQAQLRDKGQTGDLIGQAAIAKLQADMKKGLVTSDILKYAGRVASKDAQTGLPAAQTASQAEQQRYQNSVTDLAVLASGSGVEEGFARIFRTLNAGLSESGSLVKGLSEGFNEATKWADDLLLFPQSFSRALEGKDSLVADWLGVDKTGQLVKDWQDIKTLWSQMAAIKPSDLFGDFLPTLQATSKELASILNAIGEFQRWKSGQSNATTTNYNDIDQIDPFGLGSYTSPSGIAKAAANNFMVNIDKAKARGAAVYGNPNSQFYGKPEEYDENQRNMALDQAAEQATSTITSNQFDININIDPVTLSNLDVEAQAQELGSWFRNELEKAQVNFPEKE